MRRPGRGRAGWLLAVGLMAGGVGDAAQAAMLRYCDRPLTVNARQQDELLRFGGVIKDVLAKADQPAALVARSGTDLSRLGMRYSHAGVALRDSEVAPWSVRQLYYACDERRPRIFEQGMSGFVLGTDEPEIGFVSIVLLPAAPSAALAREALDNRTALGLLNPDYSANAHAWSLRYQNCNQWVAELLATAWAPRPSAGSSDAPLRREAQDWLRSEGYEPTLFDLGPALTLVGLFVPWLHTDDHPIEDQQRHRYHVSMPASIEAFVRATVPGATRVELCHKGRQVVVHRGWTDLPATCEAGPGDEVLTLE